MDALQTVSMAAGLAWASGFRIYLVLLVVGLLGHYGTITLPASLQLLANPWVIAASGFMCFVEFFADKIPGIDTLWDTVHTFIRIPGGAALAAGVVGASGDNAALTLAAAILGGTLASGSHFAKAGTRAMINTSPEPVTNWTASFSEDAMVLGGLWAIFTHPVAFLSALAVFILVVIWLLPKLWRGIYKVMDGVKRMFSKVASPGTTP
jgi:Domain of unknown function (DUF4126)